MLNGRVYSNGNRNLDIVHMDKRIQCVCFVGGWGLSVVGNVEKTSPTQPQLASHGQ